MREIKTTNIDAIIQVDDADYAVVSAYNWQAIKRKGRIICVRRFTRTKGVGRLILLHRQILGLDTHNVVVDHADGNPLNNQRSNLRICTKLENARNRNMPTTNTTGYKGVKWVAETNRFHGIIKVNGKKIHLGSFTDPALAAKAYDIAAIEYFGDYAKTNEQLGKYVKK